MTGLKGDTKLKYFFNDQGNFMKSTTITESDKYGMSYFDTFSYFPFLFYMIYKSFSYGRNVHLYFVIT